MNNQLTNPACFSGCCKTVKPPDRRTVLRTIARLAILAVLTGLWTVLAARKAPPGCRTACRQCRFFKNERCTQETA